MNLDEAETKLTSMSPIHPVEFVKGGDKIQWVGLSKREYFAAIILQGLLAGRGNVHNSSEDIVKSVDMADRLIKHLAVP